MTFQIKSYGLLIAIFLFGLSANGQDQVFSQFYAAPLQLNPALSGSGFSSRFIFNYRNQWPGFNNAYESYAASFDQYIPKINSGFGLYFLADEAGDGIYKTIKTSLHYSYALKITDETYVRAGFEAGFGQITVDWNKLVFLDQIDPISGPTLPTLEQTPNNTSQLYLDLGAGIVVHNDFLYGGMSLKHLNSPNESILTDNEFSSNNGFSPVPLRLTLHGGAEFEFGDGQNEGKTFISPNLMFVKQGNFGQINAGAYLSTPWVFGGAWFRHAFGNGDAAIFLIGLQKDVFKLGYSYDLTLSRLSGNTAGSHEISLILNLANSEKLKKKRWSNRYSDCFRMFR